MATHSSILAWKILWTEEPGRLDCRVGHNWSNFSTIFWCSDYLVLLQKLPYLFREIPQSYLRGCLLGLSLQKFHWIKHNSQLLGCAFFSVDTGFKPLCLQTERSGGCHRQSITQHSDWAPVLELKLGQQSPSRQSWPLSWNEQDSCGWLTWNQNPWQWDRHIFFPIKWPLF